MFVIMCHNLELMELEITMLKIGLNQNIGLLHMVQVMKFHKNYNALNMNGKGMRPLSIKLLMRAVILFLRGHMGVWMVGVLRSMQ